MNKSMISGLLAIILGIIYSYQALNLPHATVGKALAPIYFPLGLGTLMSVFGIVLVLQEIKKNGTKNKGYKREVDYTVKMIVFTSMISLLYAILFDVIGYVFSTIIFLYSMLMILNGVKKWKANIIISISFSVIIYITFSKLLGIILPPIPFIEF